MDWEAPVDAWYVWMAVAIVSFAIAGVALGAPSGPPPDANEAANTVDTVAGSTFQASGAYEHDATEVKLTSKTIALRNEHGTDRASFAYGEVVPVHGQYRDWGDENLSQTRLLDVVSGEPHTETYWWYNNPTTRFISDINNVYENHNREWSESEMTLTVRTIRFPPDIVDELATQDPSYIDCAVINYYCIKNELEWIHYDHTQDEFYVTLVTA